MGINTQESCTQYNLLKIARSLFRWGVQSDSCRNTVGHWLTSTMKAMFVLCWIVQHHTEALVFCILQVDGRRAIC